MLETKTLRHGEVRSPNQQGRFGWPQGSDRPRGQREAGHRTLNPSCKGPPLGAKKLTLQKHKTSGVKDTYTQFDPLLGQVKTGADAREGKQWAQGHKDSAAESNREPGCLADQSLGFPWVPDSSRDHRWKLEVTKVPKI